MEKKSFLKAFLPPITYPTVTGDAKRNTPKSVSEEDSQDSPPNIGIHRNTLLITEMLWETALPLTHITKYNFILFNI